MTTPNAPGDGALERLIVELRKPEGVYGYQSQLACRAADALAKLRLRVMELESWRAAVYERAETAESAAAALRLRVEELERELTGG